VSEPAALPASDAALAAKASACVACGLCLPHCPTYAESRSEARSPRGRILLVQQLAQGRLSADASVAAALDSCLHCRRCESVCPAAVDYATVIDGGLARLRAAQPPDPRTRQLLWLLARPWRLQLAVGLLRLAERLGLGDWLQARGLPRIGARHAVAAAATPVATPSAADAPELWLLPGCTGRALDRDTLAAATQLLTAAGYRVRLGPARCCGALHRHSGLPAQADALAEELQAAVPAGAALTSVNSGCSAELDAIFGARHIDVHPRLLARSDRLRFRPWTRALRLHLPCSARAGDGALARAVQQLLARVPGPAPSVLPPGCCGAGGRQSHLDPARAGRITAALLASAPAEGSILSCNLGCTRQLATQADAGAHSILLALAGQLVAAAGPSSQEKDDA
jgi:glycolate oxidase iron-sulfur subunit